MIRDKDAGGDVGGSSPSGGRKDEQAEALATFAATARAGGTRPESGRTPTDETAPFPTDPKVKDRAAAEVLKAGTEHDPAKAQPAVDAVPDRTRVRK